MTKSLYDAWSGWLVVTLTGLASGKENFYLFFIFRATSAAYGSSQARGASELQLPAYATATATWDPSRVHPHHSSQQCRILNPLSEVRD